MPGVWGPPTHGFRLGFVFRIPFVVFIEHISIIRRPTDKMKTQITNR